MGRQMPLSYSKINSWRDAWTRIYARTNWKNAAGLKNQAGSTKKDNLRFIICIQVGALSSMVAKGFALMSLRNIF